MDWADKLQEISFSPSERPYGSYHEPGESLLWIYPPYSEGCGSHVMKTTAVNFFINTSLVGWPKQEECRKKYGCNIPWAILLDPTSACNLHCTGCWAAEYGNKLKPQL